MKALLNKIKFRLKKVSPLMWVAFVIILLYSITLISPLYFMLTNSFKRIDDYIHNGAWSLPQIFYGENYVEAIQLSSGDVSYLGMYANSAILTFGAVIISTITATMTAYVLARFNFPGRNLLVAIGVGSLVLPDLGSSTVIYKLFVDINAIDTWLILIKYTTPFGLQFLVLYSYFKTVSGSYVEAARLDGASELRIFLQICVPLAKGALAATMVILAINNWNDFYTPYMYLPSLKTVSVGLQELSMTVAQMDKPKLFAGMTIAVAPLVVVFIAMRDVIIENTISGGLKG